MVPSQLKFIFLLWSGYVRRKARPSCCFFSSTPWLHFSSKTMAQPSHATVQDVDLLRWQPQAVAKLGTLKSSKVGQFLSIGNQWLGGTQFQETSTWQLLIISFYSHLPNCDHDQWLPRTQILWSCHIVAEIERHQEDELVDVSTGSLRIWCFGGGAAPWLDDQTPIQSPSLNHSAEWWLPDFV